MMAAFAGIGLLVIAASAQRSVTSSDPSSTAERRDKSMAHLPQ
jgi:hypothetical protein